MVAPEYKLKLEQLEKRQYLDAVRELDKSLNPKVESLPRLKFKSMNSKMYFYGIFLVKEKKNASRNSWTIS